MSSPDAFAVYTAAMDPGFQHSREEETNNCLIHTIPTWMEKPTKTLYLMQSLSSAGTHGTCYV